MKEVFKVGRFAISRARTVCGCVGLGFVWDDDGVGLMLGPVTFEWWRQ